MTQTYSDGEDGAVMNDVESHYVPMGVVRGVVADLLASRGVPAGHAGAAADVLVRTSARGFTSHGIALLPMYLDWLEAGVVRAEAEPHVAHSRGPVAVVDGDNGMGQVVASYAASVGCSIAAEHGLALVASRRSSHVGALGHYALSCAEQGFVALVWSSAPPTIHAPGGRGRVIGNGPTAYAVAGEPLIVFDASMSVGAGGKIALARSQGQLLPDGWIVDAQGRPSNDPADAPAGALVPIAAHKGFGLALLAELLSSALPAAAPPTAMPPMNPTPSRPFELGHTILLVDPGAFGDPEAFRRHVTELVGGIHRSTADPLRPVRVPGERAAARERESVARGLSVAAPLWSRLVALHAEAGAVAEEH